MAAAAAGALLAETRRRPGRLLLTGLAITVATVFAAGTLLLGETLRVYLGAENVKTPDTVAAVVMPAKVPEDVRGALVGRVSAVDGVAQAVGVLEFYPSVGSAGAATTWRVLSDPMTGSLTRLTGPPVQGTLPVGPDQVAVGVTTAERTGLVPGDKVTMRASEGAAPRTVSVTAVVPLADGGLNSLVTTPDTVAALGGFLEQVDVAAAAGVDPAALTDSISTALGAPDAARTGSDPGPAVPRRPRPNAPRSGIRAKSCWP